MKIDDISRNLGQIGNMESTGGKQPENGSKSVPIPEKENQPGAKVDFSSISVEYSRAAAKMNEVPEERARKIEELKMKVRDDMYNVDSEKIAEKIVNETLSNILD